MAPKLPQTLPLCLVSLSLISQSHSLYANALQIPPPKLRIKLGILWDVCLNDVHISLQSVCDSAYVNLRGPPQVSVLQRTCQR